METRVGRRLTRLVGAALVMGVLATPALVHAQAAQPSADEIRRAGEAFDLGKRAYRDEQWVEAAEHFEAADKAAPSAAALELALRSRERAGQLDRATTLAALALERHADDAKLAKLASAVIKKNEKNLHKLSIVCDDACDLVIDGKLVHGRAATARTVYVSEGKYTVSAGWSDDRSQSQELSATQGGASELSFKAPARKAATPEPAKPVAPMPEKPQAEPDQSTGSGGWSPVVFWIGTGLTVAAGAVTTWSGLDTVNNPGQDRVREECAGQGESCDLYQEGLDKQRRTNILAGVTAGLGVATILVGLFATDWGGSEKKAARRQPQRAAFEPWIGVGQGASLGARGRF